MIHSDAQPVHEEGSCAKSNDSGDLGSVGGLEGGLGLAADSVAPHPLDPTLYAVQQLSADAGQSSLRADRFLAERMANTSRSFVQKCFEQGYVVCNGRVIRASYRVRPQDTLTLYSPEEPEDFTLVAEPIPLDVVYEDESLLVVNKPAGMVVHPGHGHFRGTLANALLYHLRDLPGFADGSIRPGIVHRIDRDTSGLLVVGKTPRAMEHLSGQFARKESGREYVAVVWGAMPTDSGTVDASLARAPYDRQSVAICPPGQGKHAVTHWRVEERLAYLTVVRCRLETGRMHQIRVHMQSLRHPIFSDHRYGGDRALYGLRSGEWQSFVQRGLALCPRQALHAQTLGFLHPETGAHMEFSSQIPSDMQALLALWRAEGGQFS